MSKPKDLLVAHMGHDAPWLQIKNQKEVEDRITDIKKLKPEHERPLRLKLLKIVKEPLPPELDNAYAAGVKAYVALGKANVAWRKANVAWVNADAAWANADETWKKAGAAWKKADAAWQIAITSPEGIAFHQQVCGCAWTPEQPNILLQLARRPGGAGMSEQVRYQGSVSHVLRQLANDADWLLSRIATLEAERDELKAKLEAMGRAFKMAQTAYRELSEVRRERMDVNTLTAWRILNDIFFKRLHEQEKE